MEQNKVANAISEYMHSRQTVVIDLKTNDVLGFESASLLSTYLGRTTTYVDSMVRYSRKINNTNIVLTSTDDKKYVLMKSRKWQFNIDDVNTLIEDALIKMNKFTIRNMSTGDLLNFRSMRAIEKYLQRAQSYAVTTARRAIKTNKPIIFNAKGKTKYELIREENKQ